MPISCANTAYAATFPSSGPALWCLMASRRATRSTLSSASGGKTRPLKSTASSLTSAASLSRPTPKARKARRTMVAATLTERICLRKSNTILIDKAQIKIETILKELMKNKVTFAEIKSTIKNTLGRYLFAKTQRTPYIIPVIMNKN